MMFSFSTCGKGRRQTSRAASARTLTRVSLYLYTLPGLFRARFVHVAGSGAGRSAQSGLPHSVPSQSLVCRSRLSHVIVRLCAVSNSASKPGSDSESDLLTEGNGL